MDPGPDGNDECRQRHQLPAPHTIASSIAGDTINFASTLAGQTISLTSGAALTITHNLTITGLGANSLTIDAGHLSRIFNINGSQTTVQISNLTLSDGLASSTSPSPDKGDAIFDSHGSLTLQGDFFLSDTAVGTTGTLGTPNGGVAQGGAVYHSGSGSLTISGSTFTSDSAQGQRGRHRRQWRRSQRWGHL